MGVGWGVRGCLGLRVEAEIPEQADGEGLATYLKFQQVFRRHKP